VVAFNILGDQEAAKDVVQEFFAKCWQKRHELAITGSFEAYAVKAVRNASLNYIEKQERLEAHQQKFSYHPELSTDHEAREQFYQNIYSALESMPDQRKRIFLLSIQDGFTYQQIADKVGISINTVKWHVKAAYQFLREKCLHIYLLFILALVANFI